MAPSCALFVRDGAAMSEREEMDWFRCNWLAPRWGFGVGAVAPVTLFRCTLPTSTDCALLLFSDLTTEWLLGGSAVMVPMPQLC